MTRNEVIQSILDLFENPSYLEIGVNRGETFLPLKANRKIAVDPEFLFDYKKAAEADLSSTFYQVTSNKYFGSIVQPNHKFDVIFLDGLHTFEQTLADFCSAVICLSEDGVIVIDDVIPSSYHASLKDHRLSVRLRTVIGRETNDKSWMGDVYRLVFFIDNYFHQFTCATLTENHGQLIVWREPRDLHGRNILTPEEISRLPFESAWLDRDAYNVRAFADVMQRLKFRQRNPVERA